MYAENITKPKSLADAAHSSPRAGGKPLACGSESCRRDEAAARAARNGRDLAAIPE
jgi:hypothetical protein